MQGDDQVEAKDSGRKKSRAFGGYSTPACSEEEG